MLFICLLYYYYLWIHTVVFFFLSFFFFLPPSARAALWDLCLLERGNMAEAFGDDLFSVFDDEQTTSTKKTSSKTESRVGYVVILQNIWIIALQSALFGRICIYLQSRLAHALAS